MNRNNQLLTLLLLLSFLSFNLEAQQTHTIILNVDTRAISDQNINEVSNFGQTDGVSNRDFTTVVNSGDLVVWKGVSSSNPDTDEVLISAINHEGGERVFDRNTLKDSNQNPGVVVGLVGTGKEGKEEKYKISFKVLNDGTKRGGTFHIDPKIQVKN